MEYSEHPDYIALVRSVLLSPGDDLPRLVIADWLDEYGDPDRAEFIRIQCNLAEEHPGHDHWPRRKKCRPCELFLRAFSLLNPNHAQRGQSVPQRAIEYRHPLGGQPYSISRWFDAKRFQIESIEWKRGFVSDIRIPIYSFTGGRCECTPAPQVNGRTRLMMKNSLEIEICPKCKGSGLLESLAKELFATHPIERVVYSDRKPWKDNSGKCPLFDWPSDDLGFNREMNAKSDLPPTLRPIGRFSTLEEAMDAANVMALEYGRGLAFPTT